jgi:hypothetical protein
MTRRLLSGDFASLSKLLESLILEISFCWVFILFTISGATPLNAAIIHTMSIEYYDNLEKLTRSSRIISVDSLGGDAFLGLKIGELLNDRKTSIIVDTCVSACAEFMIPGALRVITRPDSFIAFHISDLISEKFTPYAPPGIAMCRASTLDQGPIQGEEAQVGVRSSGIRAHR